MPDNNIKIVICTHNRSHDAISCVRSVIRSLGHSVCKIQIVDSASKDEHSNILTKACQKLSNVHYIRTETPGLSIARNIGYSHEDSGWICYLDDDVEVHQSWWQGLVAAVEKADEATAALGGAIIPAYPPGVDSSMVTERWKLLLSCIERSTSGHVHEGANVCGANMVIRVKALLMCGGFKSELGRVGGRLLSGEESLLFEQLAGRNLKVKYDPVFFVYHKISAERLTLKWIAERAYYEGVSQVLLRMHLGKAALTFAQRCKLKASATLFGLRQRDADSLIRASMARGALNARAQAVQATKERDK